MKARKLKNAARRVAAREYFRTKRWASGAHDVWWFRASIALIETGERVADDYYRTPYVPNHATK